MSRPEWLRREGLYRAYILGLRWALGWAAAFALVAALGVNQVVGGTATRILALLCLAGGAIAVLTGVTGWLLVPDKKRAASLRGLPGMIAHDVFLGIPAQSRTATTQLPDDWWRRRPGGR